MSVGARIKQRRLELGLSAEQLGKKINKNRATVYRYESNDIENLPTNVIQELAVALETTPAYLMGWRPNYAEFFSGVGALKNAIKTTHVEYSIEETIVDKILQEANKLNDTGKNRLLQHAKEMACNPLYNDNYETELAAAHKRTDIEIPEGIDTSDDDAFKDF